MAGTNQASISVRVKPRKITRLGTFKVASRRTKVSGTVRGSDGARLAGAHVTVRDSFGLVLGTARTKANGAYALRGTVRGAYSLELFDPEQRSAETSKGFSVSRGVSSRVNARMEKGYRVKGTVRADGEAVGGLVVTASAAWDTTGTRGRFTLRNLPRGTHVLQVHDPYTGGHLDLQKKVKVTKNRNLALVMPAR